MSERQAQRTRQGWQVHRSETDVEAVYVASPSRGVPHEGLTADERDAERHGVRQQTMAARERIASFIGQSPGLALAIFAAVGFIVAFPVRRWLDSLFDDDE